MKKYFIFVYCFLFFSSSILFAQLPANCTGAAPRVAIAGDSWAQFMADDGTHNAVLNSYGHADKDAISETFSLCVGCSGSSGPDDYAISGSEARQWADEVNYDYLQNLIDALNANPTVDWVLLSIGGNDILAGRSGGGWYKNMDLDMPGSEAALFAKIKSDTEYIMNEVWARANANIKFMISSYDFPNFNVSALWCGFYACPKREDLSRDDNMNGSIDPSELITDVELNSMMETVESIRKVMADMDARVFYDNGMGLTDYYYGYDDTHYPNFLPGTTPHPLGVSPYTTGGDPNIPTDRNNFRLVGLLGLPGIFPADPIHLDAETYEYKIKNQLDNLLFEDFRKNTTNATATFWSDGTQDGYIDIIGNATETNGIRVGDDGVVCCSGPASNEYRGIFSFDTSVLPNNAQITGASLYVIRSSENDNPFEKGDRFPLLDIKKGHFGTSPSLELIDGTEAADATDIGCFHGVVEADKYALRVDIGAGGLTHINTTGTTQLRMYFNISDWSPEYVNFYDGAGTTALLAPEVAFEQYVPKYSYRIVRKRKNADGTFTETTIETGDLVAPREGFILEEKLQKVEEEPNGDLLQTYVLYTPLEHAGLAKYMSDTYNAPSGGYAPFLDVSYILVLPIELTDFSVVKKGQIASLSWVTASETNAYGFSIEHSTNQENWETIGFVPSKNVKNSAANYQFTHQTPVKGNNYYRLKMEDIDGAFKYSEIRHLSFDHGILAVKVFPNPFNRQLFLEADFGAAISAEIQLLDVLGRVVTEQKIAVTEGIQFYIVEMPADLLKGHYWLKIVADDGIHLEKITKE